MPDDLRVASLAKRVQRLEAMGELGQLIVRYGMAVDDRDLDELADCFTSDAVMEHPVGRCDNWPQIRAFFEERLRPYGMTYHRADMHRIDWLDGELASGVVSGSVQLAIEGHTYVGALRYLDEYRIEAGRWRIAARLQRWLYIMPVEQLSTGLAGRDRCRWHDSAPRPADLPEGLTAFKRFIAEEPSP